MTLALEAALVLLIAWCLVRAGVVRERARWIGFVRWTARDCDGAEDFEDRMVGAATVLETRGWR